MLALLRLVEADGVTVAEDGSVHGGGSIKIDGVDTASIGVHDVRSKIAIIPQVHQWLCLAMFV